MQQALKGTLFQHETTDDDAGGGGSIHVPADLDPARRRHYNQGLAEVVSDIHNLTKDLLFVIP